MKNVKAKSGAKIATLMVEEIPSTVKKAYSQGGGQYFQGNAIAGAMQDDCGGDEDKMQSKSQVTALAVQSFVYVAKREGFTKAKLIALINDEWKEDREI